MAKTGKPIPKTEQAQDTEKRPSKRIKDHDIFMRGLFDFVQFASKILHYAVPEDLKPYILDVQVFQKIKVLEKGYLCEKKERGDKRNERFC